MITISPKRVAAWLTLIVVALVLANSAVYFSAYVLGHGRLFGIARLFNLDYERNIPSWYASISLLACSVLLATIAKTQPKETRPKAGDWWTLSIIFLFLSIDELASIHELFINPVRNTLGTTGIFHYAWVIPYGGLVLLLGLRYVKFLAQLPARTRRSFVVSGAIYIGGALGMEMVGSWHVTLYGQQNLAYALIMSVEETLEMLGIVVFLHALLTYLKRYVTTIQISIGNNASEVLPEMTPERSHTI
uniref:hypothetical protein n=1 Tax=Trichocoleus desertorum TaxID=1481672 RepID=UPI0025B4DD39|nr:hypothetical protein [Trichocoleus desertorum]